MFFSVVVFSVRPALLNKAEGQVFLFITPHVIASAESLWIVDMLTTL